MPILRGLISPWGMTSILAASFVIRTNLAHSDPSGPEPAHEAAIGTPVFTPTQVDPDPPPWRRQTEPDNPPSWDLDGWYVWLGPTGAASRVEQTWDSTIGASLAVVRVREHEPLGAVGGSIGATRWTERGGGRVWADALAGTHLGRMVGVSAGALLELDDFAHPRIGASFGVWAFLGVTPFVRVGTAQELGGFVEIGVHLALPVIRRRH